MRVDAGELLDRCATALERHGAPALAARRQAEQLVEGELRGHPSHGIQRLAILVARLDAGLIVPGAHPELTWRAASALLVDGRGGFGPVIADQVLDALEPRARETGVAVAAVHRSHHLGMLAPYVERVASAGLVGMMFTTTEGLVHPWGGAGSLVGTNPIAIGVPSRDGPVVLDMSTAASSAGRILHHAARGEPIPAGWGVDADGRSTTDAAAVAAISPFGGAKGYALGITLGAMVGLLSGTSFGSDVAGTLDGDRPVTKGDVVVVIDPAAFGVDPGDPAMARYLDAVRASGADGAVVGIPGDRARAARAAALEHGVEVDAHSWAAVQRLAAGGRA